MAPRKKSRRTATAIMAASMLGGLHARPVSAHPAPSSRPRPLAIHLAWLDERFGDPWHLVSRVIDPTRRRRPRRTAASAATTFPKARSRR